jgi:hypothetical protein
VADTIPPGKNQKPANDNKSCCGGMCAIVMISEDSPIMQVEIEVIAFLLDNWAGVPANDNEEPSK